METQKTDPAASLVLTYLACRAPKAELWTASLAWSPPPASEEAWIRTWYHSRLLSLYIGTINKIRAVHISINEEA